MSDKLEKIISLVAQIDPEAARKAAEELKQINALHVQDIKDSEDKAASYYQDALNKRMELARKELNELEDKTTSHYEKEIEQLKRLQEANETKYKFIADKAKQANETQLEATKVLTERELDEYKRYLQNREVLHKRQLDIEKQSEQDASKEGFFKKASNFLTGGQGFNVQQLAGQAVNIGMMGMPNTTEEDKKNKIAGETLENVVKSRTPLEALVNIGTGIARTVEASYQEQRRRTFESLRAAGGTMQFDKAAVDAEGKLLDRYEKLRKTLEEHDLVLRQNMKEVDSVVTEMGRRSVMGFGGKGEAEQKDIFLKVRQSADLLGENWTQHARNIADLSRKNGVSIQESIDSTNRVFLTAQKVAKEFGELDLQGFVHNWQNLHAALQPLGFTIDDTTKIMARFSRELDKGVISLNDLVQWATGITKADDANRAFLFQQMLKVSSGRPEFAEINKTLRQAESQGPLAQSYLLEALMENNQSELKRLGLSDSGIGRTKGLLQATQQQMAFDFSGGTGGLAGEAAADFFWRKFAAPTAGQNLEGRTIAQRRDLITAGQEGFADRTVVVLEESKKELEKQTFLLDQITKQERKAQGKSLMERGADSLFDFQGSDHHDRMKALLSPREESSLSGIPKGSMMSPGATRAAMVEHRRAWGEALEKYAAEYQKAEATGDFSKIGQVPRYGGTYSDNDVANRTKMYGVDADFDVYQRRFVKDELEPVLERALSRQQSQGYQRKDWSISVQVDSSKEDAALKSAIEATIDAWVKANPKATAQEIAIKRTEIMKQKQAGNYDHIGAPGGEPFF